MRATAPGDGLSSVALLVNPSAGNGNRKGLALARRLRGGAGVRAFVLETFTQIEPYLAELAENPPEVLAISSGDGTIHYIQTWLIERSGLPPARWPLLMVLPHGSTNMTAADIGFRDTRVTAQAEAIERAAWRGNEAAIISRPTVKVVNPAHKHPLHGMFLGGGVIAEATLFCRDRLNRKGIKGQLGPLLTLIGLSLRAIFNPAKAGDAHRVDRPHRMRVRLDGEVVADGWQLAVLATTLKKLVLNARPFWGGCAGSETPPEEALRFSLFGHPPPNLLRWLPVVLYGGEERNLPEGMLSRCIERAELETHSRFAIDGEEIEAPEGSPLIIERGPLLRYFVG